MASSLSSLVDNFAEGLQNNKYQECKSCLQYIKAKDKLLIFNGSGCNKNYENNFLKRFN